MFIALLSAWTIERFSEPLASNSEGRLKRVSLKKRPRQA